MAPIISEIPSESTASVVIIFAEFCLTIEENELAVLYVACCTLVVASKTLFPSRTIDLATSHWVEQLNPPIMAIIPPVTDMAFVKVSLLRWWLTKILYSLPFKIKVLFETFEYKSLRTKNSLNSF